MRRTLAIGLLMFLYIASALLLITKADNFPNCRDIFSCSTGTGTAGDGSTMCTINVSYHGCDGTQPGSNQACVNTGCISSCSCSCQGSSPTLLVLRRVGSTVMVCSGRSAKDAVVVHANGKTKTAMRTIHVVRARD